MGHCSLERGAYTCGCALRTAGSPFFALFRGICHARTSVISETKTSNFVQLDLLMVYAAFCSDDLAEEGPTSDCLTTRVHSDAACSMKHCFTPESPLHHPEFIVRADDCHSALIIRRPRESRKRSPVQPQIGIMSPSLQGVRMFQRDISTL